MRTRLTLAAVCILALPLWFSASPGDKPTSPTPSATVAYAGHTIIGDWCGCGAPGCICDPGEEPGGQSVRRVPDKNETTSDQAASPGPDPGLDFGSGALMLAFALFVWARLRT